jgi:CheY-like chemotaxis protein
MDLEWSTFSVREALENGLALMRERAARKSISLNLEAAPELGLIHADELRFKQVMLNLLSNAVKFTPEGGAVVVRATSDGSEVSVTVTDTGIGVAATDQARIFESFQQGGRGAQPQEGTGLGLTLCRRIVGLLGGRMWLQSEVGKGSTFGFALPLGAPESAQSPRSDESTPHGGPLVVVIEDDRRSLDLMRLYLQRAGVEVVGVRDGATGLEVVRQKRPSAVVLDIRLPGMDGWDVLATLKADPGTAPIPVVVVSMVDERGRGFALGAAEYLVKPVGRDDVLSALSRVIVLPDSDRSILAIDDDPLVIEFVKAVLEPEGWQVLGAADGETGVALARSRQPAVVLLDLLLPGMDGFEIAGALHDDSATRHIPIIVLTSTTMTRADKERLRGRISYVAQKGTFDPAHLVALVQGAIEAPAASAWEG